MTTTIKQKERKQREKTYPIVQTSTYISIYAMCQCYNNFPKYVNFMLVHK